MRGLLFNVFFFLTVSVALSSTKNRDNISVQELPDSARLFIMKHFFLEGVLSCRFDESKSQYQVKLDNRIEIYFDNKGTWLYLDSPVIPISSYVLDVLPPTLLRYLSENYPNAEVYQIMFQKKKYQLFLDTYPKIRLDFGDDGSFLQKNELK